MKCILTLGSEYFVFTLLPNNKQTVRYGIVIIGLTVIYVGRYSDFLWAEGFGDPIPVMGEIFRTGLDMRSFPGVKSPGLDFYHPSHLALRLKKEYN